MRRQRIRAEWLGIAVALLVVSCSAPAGTAAVYKIATAPVRSDFMLLARADGVIHGQINSDGTACFWLGTTGPGVALSWPYGYSARAEPLAVYDDGGTRVAAVGQTVTIAGGLMADGVRSITGCSGFSQFWGVGEVVSAN